MKASTKCAVTMPYLSLSLRRTYELTQRTSWKHEMNRPQAVCVEQCAPLLIVHWGAWRGRRGRGTTEVVDSTCRAGNDTRLAQSGRTTRGKPDRRLWRIFRESREDSGHVARVCRNPCILLSRCGVQYIKTYCTIHCSRMDVWRDRAFQSEFNVTI